MGQLTFEALPERGKILRVLPPAPDSPFGVAGRLEVSYNRPKRIARILCAATFPCLLCCSCLWMSALREDVTEVFDIPPDGVPPQLEISDEAARGLREIYPGAEQFYTKEEIRSLTAAGRWPPTEQRSRRPSKSQRMTGPSGQQPRANHAGPSRTAANQQHPNQATNYNYSNNNNTTGHHQNGNGNGNGGGNGNRNSSNVPPGRSAAYASPVQSQAVPREGQGEISRLLGQFSGAEGRSDQHRQGRGIVYNNNNNNNSNNNNSNDNNNSNNNDNNYSDPPAHLQRSFGDARPHKPRPGDLVVPNTRSIVGPVVQLPPSGSPDAAGGRDAGRTVANQYATRQPGGGGRVVPAAQAMQRHQQAW